MKFRTVLLWVIAPVIVVGLSVVVAFSLKINSQNENLNKRLTNANHSMGLLTKAGSAQASTITSLKADVHLLVVQSTRRQPTLHYLECQNARSHFTGLIKAQADNALVALVAVAIAPHHTQLTEDQGLAFWVFKTSIYDRALATPDTCNPPPSNP